jgi:crotonobetainyl-CoA:carnitine CoA-transferase CaiB-like acyl-CoA transferase
MTTANATAGAAAAAAEPSLTGVRILELGGMDSAAQLCGRLLADAGADVTAADEGSGPPGGDRHAAYEWHRRYHGQRALRLRPADLAPLAEQADVVLADQDWVSRLAAAGHRLDDLTAGQPGLVVAALTPYGLTGPLAGHAASDLLLQAVTGIAMTNGYDGEPPLQAGVPIPTMAAAAFGASAVVAALVERQRSGRGQLIDVSGYDAALCCLGTLLPTVFRTGRHLRRIGNRHTMGAPWNAYPTSDGWVVITTMGQTLWHKVAALTGQDGLADDPRFADPVDRVANVEELDEIISRWTRKSTTGQILDQCAGQDVPAGRIPTLTEALQDIQLRSRPVLAAGEDGRPFPGPLPSARDTDPVGDRPSAAPDDPEPGLDTLPLDGVRVLELGAFTAGPLAGRLLGALGADVLKVEPPKGENCRSLTERVDGSGYLFHLNNTDKRGAVADLTAPEDRQRVQALAAGADVLLTNLSDGVLTAAGLDEAALRPAAPGLIYCAISAYGHTGPLAGRKAFDSVIQAHAGAMALTGWPSGAPLKAAISWADVMSAALATFGVVCALYARPSTGRGRTIDLALLDAVAWSTQLRWAEAVVGDAEPSRLGNGHQTDAPHGVYPCADGWLSLHVTSDDQWQSLAGLLDDDRADPDLATAAGRRARSSIVDDAISEWTATRTATEAVTALSQAGVPAGPVQDLPAVVAHPHTSARGMLIEQHTPNGHRLTVLGTPWKFSRSPVRVRRPAPGLGQQELTW